MKSLLELYGQQFRNPMPNSDSEDYTTADVFGQMGANKRRAEYDNSLLGMVHNWATGEQRQPVQLPDDASWLDQAKEAGARFLNLPNDMAAGGAKTMAHWLGAAGNPEMVEPQDMLAPLGIGAMAGLGGVVPRGAVGSAGGKLASNALDMSQEARMQRAREMGFDTDTTWYHGTRSEFDEFEPSKGGTIGPGVYVTKDGQAAGDYARFAGGIGKQDRGGESVMPLMVRGNIADMGQYQALMNGPLDRGLSYRDAQKAASMMLQGDGYSGVRYGDQVAVFDPSNIRSVNAAFDPAKSDSANLLAADQARGSLPGLLAGAVDEQPKGIRAFHGSPHDFDRFSLDKIGTGEGAQAYGHGLYFAENEGVAKSYRDNLSADRAWKSQDIRDAEPVMADRLRALGYSDDVAASVAQSSRLEHTMNTPADKLQKLYAPRGDEYMRAMNDAWGIKDEVYGGPTGRMYEVRINADPEDFLDWDKPLSQQSKPVRDAVKELRPDEQTVRMISDLEAKEASGAGNYASRMLLARLKKRFGSHAVEQDVRGSSIMSDERAAALLRDSGIPGIRYLDQGSRGAGEGSRNYVLFRDDIIEIVKKYGIAAAASMYGMSQVQDAMASEGP